LQYADLQSLTYSTVRNVNDGYSTLSLLFEPASEVEAGAIRARFIYKGDEPAAFRTVRERASGPIAERMRKDLAQHSSVRWNDDLVFRQDSLEYTTGPGWFSREEPAALPYENLTGYDIKDGTMFLVASGNKKPQICVKCSDPNFFPGFLLLRQLAKQMTPTNVSWFSRFFDY
jgi:hypothetical protein